MSDKITDALSTAFGEPIHVPAREFLERSLAGMFGRQPDMSGDQRKRLNGRELRAVEDMAGNILAAMSMSQVLPTDEEEVETAAKAIADEIERQNGDDGFWSSLSENERDSMRQVARAALNAVRGE